MMVLWGSRMWLLYWDYTSSQLQVKMIWRKQMDDQYHSWFLSHAKFGRTKNVLIGSFTILVLNNIIIDLLTSYTNLSHIVHWFATLSAAVFVIALGILCVQLHRFVSLFFFLHQIS